MGKDDKRGRKYPWDPFWLSADMRYLEEIMARMMRQAFRGFEEFPIRREPVKRSSRRFKKRRPHIRGFFVKRGANRKPVVKKFGGWRPKTPGRDK